MWGRRSEKDEPQSTCGSQRPLFVGLRGLFRQSLFYTALKIPVRTAKLHVAPYGSFSSFRPFE